MKYMGSKNRIAKYIVPIIQKKIDDNNVKTYVEPFVGGANVIDKISCETKIGCDKQKYLIALYQNLDKITILPDFITKEHYTEVRECCKNNEHIFEDWYIGAIGFLSSYNGRFFDGGYAGIVQTKDGNIRNYYNEAKRNLEQQIQHISDVKFYQGDYWQTCSCIKDALIYCDPPYSGTKQYNVSKNFNHDEFWEWCKEMSHNNIVLISEQVARDDFKCIWEEQVQRTMNNRGRAFSIERLFEYKY